MALALLFLPSEATGCVEGSGLVGFLAPEGGGEKVSRPVVYVSLSGEKGNGGGRVGVDRGPGVV
jgi:hypothetical protein